MTDQAFYVKCTKSARTFKIKLVPTPFYSHGKPYLEKQAIEKEKKKDFSYQVELFLNALERGKNKIGCYLTDKRTSTIYTTSKYFTKGCIKVSSNAVNFYCLETTRVPLFIFTANKYKDAEFALLETSHIPNRANYIQKYFAFHDVKQEYTVPPGSFYFFYTPSHCKFTYQEREVKLNLMESCCLTTETGNVNIEILNKPSCPGNIFTYNEREARLTEREDKIEVLNTSSYSGDICKFTHPEREAKPNFMEQCLTTKTADDNTEVLNISFSGNEVLPQITATATLHMPTINDICHSFNTNHCDENSIKLEHLNEFEAIVHNLSAENSDGSEAIVQNQSAVNSEEYLEIEDTSFDANCEFDAIVSNIHHQSAVNSEKQEHLKNAHLSFEANNCEFDAIVSDIHNQSEECLETTLPTTSLEVPTEEVFYKFFQNSEGLYYVKYLNKETMTEERMTDQDTKIDELQNVIYNLKYKLLELYSAIP